MAGLGRAGQVSGARDCPPGPPRQHRLTWACVPGGRARSDLDALPTWPCCVMVGLRTVNAPAFSRALQMLELSLT